VSSQVARKLLAQFFADVVNRRWVPLAAAADGSFDGVPVLQSREPRLDRREPGVDRPCNPAHGERRAAQALHRFGFTVSQDFHRREVAKLTGLPHGQFPSSHAAKPGD
jgi:hypothetical protein